MSLPSYAIYYDKDDNKIHREFVNVGWFLSEEIWLDCASTLPIIYGADHIELYGVQFPAKWLRNKKYKSLIQQAYQDHAVEYRSQQSKTVETQIEKLKARDTDHTEFKRIMIPMIRRRTPELIAADIVGVQPMQEHVGQIFKMKHRLGSKYKIIRYIQNKYSKLKQYYNEKALYVKSIIKWYTK